MYLRKLTGLFCPDGDLLAGFELLGGSSVARYKAAVSDGEEGLDLVASLRCSVSTRTIENQVGLAFLRPTCCWCHLPVSVECTRAPLKLGQMKFSRTQKQNEEYQGSS